MGVDYGVPTRFGGAKITPEEMARYLGDSIRDGLVNPFATPPKPGPSKVGFGFDRSGMKPSEVLKDHLHHLTLCLAEASKDVKAKTQELEQCGENLDSAVRYYEEVAKNLEVFERAVKFFPPDCHMEERTDG